MTIIQSNPDTVVKEEEKDQEIKQLNQTPVEENIEQQKEGTTENNENFKNEEDSH
eukprot:Pgem_evm1s11948